MDPYVRTVQYYETDMMGVTHHANYIHWMEEARICFMDQIGFPYAEMEAKGVVSPVVEIFCKYRKPCTFGDEISVSVSVVSFGGVKMTRAYEMRGKDGALLFEAQSVHAFLDRDGRVVRMRREMPDFCAAIDGLIKESGLPEE